MFDISLIKNWHEKSKEDYFSRYTFEYLAFEAFLKKFKYTNHNGNERTYLQLLKQDADYQIKWSALIESNQEYKKILTELCSYLENEPLQTSRKNWWGCSSSDFIECDAGRIEGKINNETDFTNIIEYWYQVRNNLFHGGKNPDSSRDSKIVMYAHKTLSIAMENIFIPEIEGKTITPAIWENFEHKFFKGDAEVAIKIGTSEAYANVYELLHVDEKYFPLYLNGKRIDRNLVIEKLSFNLVNLSGDPYLLQEEWDKIVLRAYTPEQKSNLTEYFKDIMYIIKDVIR